MQGRRSSLLKVPDKLVAQLVSLRALVLLALLSALFPLVIFPAAGIGDRVPLDLHLYYSPDQVREHLDTLGAEGRAAYLAMATGTDLLFPVVYALALSVALALCLRRLLAPDSRLRHLRLLPLLIVIADWGENLNLAVVLRAYPERSDTYAATASLFTSLKWGLLGLVACILLVTGVLAAIRQRRRG